MTPVQMQRCRGPQPLSCPSNHTLVLGCAGLSQNTGHLQPAQRTTSKAQQQAPKPSITPSSSSQTHLGAGRALASLCSYTAWEPSVGSRKGTPQNRTEDTHATTDNKHDH